MCDICRTTATAAGASWFHSRATHPFPQASFTSPQTSSCCYLSCYCCLHFQAVTTARCMSPNSAAALVTRARQQLNTTAALVTLRGSSFHQGSHVTITAARHPQQATHTPDHGPYSFSPILLACSCPMLVLVTVNKSSSCNPSRQQHKHLFRASCLCTNTARTFSRRENCPQSQTQAQTWLQQLSQKAHQV